jgi:alanyl-tRNA synthetase
MREQMDALRSKVDSGVLALAARQEDGKVSLIVAVTKDLVGRFKAGDIVKQAAAEVGGGGGGRPDMAQAGGTNPDGIPAALDKVRQIVAAG